MRLSRIATSPRIISLLWAIWAFATALAYWDVTPTQLDPITSILPGDWVFTIWLTASLMMLMGAVIPNQVAARWLRIAGLSLTAWLLIAWGLAYAWESWGNGNRMWVSAKNYVFMSITAMGTAQIIGRERNPQDIPDGSRI